MPMPPALAKDFEYSSLRNERHTPAPPLPPNGPSPSMPVNIWLNIELRNTASKDFEAVFLNQMFQSMFTGIDGDGPFGGKGATGVWRSFLTDEYAKSFTKAGGIGIADHIYKTLIAQQEARS